MLLDVFNDIVFVLVDFQVLNDFIELGQLFYIISIELFAIQRTQNSNSWPLRQIAEIDLPSIRHNPIEKL